MDAKLALHPHASLVQRDRSVGLFDEPPGQCLCGCVWVLLREPSGHLSDYVTRHASSSVQLPSASA
jgi:hypothetical protein